MSPKRFRIIGIKVDEFGRLVRREVERDEFAGDYSACSAKFHMMRLGYRVAIKPTPEVWTEDLEVDNV